MPTMALAALGIVFGDIGTSPLYTLKECFDPEHGARPTPENVLGVLSLIFWALTMVVTVKYLLFIMRADNKGEGGILALLALIPEKFRITGKGRIGAVAFLVILGASLLYGDGMITPAISVLSAMEGLEIAAPSLTRLVLPLTVAILIGLFAIQQRGTGTVGVFFGPIMAVWFLVIGGLGAFHIAGHPQVLAALSPHHALGYFVRHGIPGFAILGSVVLAVTGGEALYADMGHFGAKPIRVAWIFVAMPCLVLCYFGQGALVLGDASLSDHSFFAMVPVGPATIALVVLSSMATVIASQALISGAFSLTHQAVQLGFFPRVEVRHTSHEAEGQIYVPFINWLLAIACVALVLTFKESSKLAAAYGIAVTGTMGITSCVYFVVLRSTWKWSMARALPVLVLFLAFDIPFFLSNLDKFLDGGWVPVAVALVFLAVMVTWNTGRRILRETLQSHALDSTEYVRTLPSRIAARIPGAGIFLSSVETGVPPVLQHQVERIHTLPDQVVLLTVVVEHVPVVAPENRVELRRLHEHASRVIAHYGFTEKPDVPQVVGIALPKLGIECSLDEITYFVGHETFLATKAGRMGALPETLFAFLTRNAWPASAHLCLPPKQVVELGSQIDL
jgi:KUP system potassium uptake protein